MEISTPKMAWMMFGMMPADDAIMPAATDVPFTVASINISKRKYPRTITHSPIAPEITSVGISLAFENLSASNWKIRYPTSDVRAFMINVAGTYVRYPANKSESAEPRPAASGPKTGPSNKLESKTNPSPG